MKKKKVKKEVIRKSVEFDSDEDPETRAERFEKFLPKVKSVTLVGNYLTMT